MLDHLNLAAGIARAVARSLPPSFDLEDLIGTANLALLHAATRYRPGAHNGTPFSAYARLVIRGAVLESVRRKRYIENTLAGLDDNDPAAPATADAGSAVERVDREREDRKLIHACAALPAQQQRVLALKYSPAELTMAEVGARLKITPLQARYQHTVALRTLRTRLKKAA